MDYNDISQQHELIEELFLEGATRIEISNITGIPTHRLKPYMVSQGWYKKPLLSTESEFVEIMESHDWNNSKAARAIGCSEATVRARRAQYGYI